MKPPNQRTRPADAILTLLLIAFGLIATLVGFEVPSGLLLSSIGYVGIKVITQ